MRQNPSPTARVVSLLFLTLALGSLNASTFVPAHDEAELESKVSSVAGGGTLPLRGHHFEEGESYSLRLVGALREYDLQKMKPDDAGTFSLELPIPREVVPGVYQLVAVAEDGDVVARLDLTILEPSPAKDAVAGASSAEGEGAETHGHGETAARAGDIRIERNRSGLGWGIIGLLVGLAGGLGVGLFRRA